MPNDNIEIEVSDPTAPAENSPPLARTLTVDIWAMVVLAGFSLVMAWDNYRTGMGWTDDVPEPGYFPFYLSAILVLASVYGIVKSLYERRATGRNAEVFVTRDQFKLVMLVFLPAALSVLGRAAWWFPGRTSTVTAQPSGDHRGLAHVETASASAAAITAPPNPHDGP